MSILTIEGLSHRFEDKILFDSAQLSVNNFEHCGIVGLNGAGKSTFMKILIGSVLHDTGEVTWLKNLHYGYLDQHADIDRSLNVMDYLKSSFQTLFNENDRMESLYESLSTETDSDKIMRISNQANTILETLTAADFFDVESNIKKVANGLGVHLFGYDTLIGTLSGGQRAKLMLAKLLLEKPEVLLLDEPTNFLDIEHIDWLVAYLNQFEGAFLLISHDAEFLDKVSKFIISLENRTIRKYSGNYSQFISQHESNMKQYAENYGRQQEEIKRLETFVAKNKARASTAGMARSRQNKLDKMVEMEKPISTLKPHFAFPFSPNSARTFLSVKNLEIGYDKRLLPPISFDIKSDTKLWIRGTNGVGKSTLLKTIMGLIPSLGGSFEFNINTKTNYLEQDFSFQNGSFNAYDYISNVFPRLSKQQLRTMLAGTGLKAQLALRQVCLLSGGEQVRIKLCECMNRSSNLLILDEPTNHLDSFGKEALKEAIETFEGAMILVTHEPAFAESICNDIWNAD